VTAAEKKKNDGRQLLIHRPWCKGCGICVAFCPKNVLELNEEEKVISPRIEDCIYCSLCEIRCPDFAIQVYKEAERKDKDR
jgi:2-oxoglutarate ferredoxin oxidoreductase subunit delta